MGELTALCARGAGRHREDAAFTLPVTCRDEQRLHMVQYLDGGVRLA